MSDKQQWVNGYDSITSGAVILDDIRKFIRRFCVFPDAHCLTAVTLWAAHAHIIDRFYTTPRLALVSPEPESGKTRVLEVLNLMVPNPMLAFSASPAAIFRTLAEGTLTLLFDEIDTIWSARGQDDNHEDLRALLNAGYKRGATIPRCVGPKHEVQQFSVFCAVALAGIGAMPDTILTRSIIIKMRRRAAGEPVEPFRLRQHEPEGHKLRDRLTRWCAEIGAGAGDAWPTMPPGIVDRPAEIWEPLLAIADAAGGHWPDTARAACMALCEAAKDRRVSLGVRLLADLRTIFGEEDTLYTKTIIGRLLKPEAHGLDADAPWGDIKGREISDRVLASLLKKYGIKPVKVREGGVGDDLQGYRRADLWDAWQRWLPPTSGQAEHPEQAEQARNGAAVPLVPDVPDVRTSGSAAPLARDGTRATALYSQQADDADELEPFE